VTDVHGCTWRHTCTGLHRVVSMYLLQMTALVVIGHADSSRAAEVVLAILRMQSPDTEGSLGFCVVNGLTSTSKVALEAVAQLSIAAAMAIVYFVVSGALRAKRHGGSCSRALRRADSRFSSAKQALLGAAGGGGPLADSDVGLGGVYGALSLAASAGGSGIASMGIEATEAPMRDHCKVVVVQGSLSHRARIFTAAVNFLLTAYATITVASVKMLHCVWVPGTSSGQRRLFIQGSHICDYSGWQLPIIGVVALLAATPVALPFVSAWSIRAGGGSRPYRPTSFKYDLQRGVRRALAESYNDNTPWWEAVLMAQRLVSSMTFCVRISNCFSGKTQVEYLGLLSRCCDLREQILALIYTFASSDPGVQSLLLTLTCTAFLAVHLLMLPLRSQQSQTLQSMLLFCLVGVAMSELPFTIQLEKGVASSQAGVKFSSDTVGRWMQVAFRVVLPVMAVVSTYVVEWVFGQRVGSLECGYRLRQALVRWRHRRSRRLAKAAGVGVV
jgi:hypothetical protein